MRSDETWVTGVDLPEGRVGTNDAPEVTMQSQVGAAGMRRESPTIKPGEEEKKSSTNRIYRVCLAATHVGITLSDDTPGSCLKRCLLNKSPCTVISTLLLFTARTAGLRARSRCRRRCRWQCRCLRHPAASAPPGCECGAGGADHLPVPPLPAHPAAQKPQAAARRRAAGWKRDGGCEETAPRRCLVMGWAGQSRQPAGRTAGPRCKQDSMAGSNSSYWMRQPAGGGACWFETTQVKGRQLTPALGAGQHCDA